MKTNSGVNISGPQIDEGFTRFNSTEKQLTHRKKTAEALKDYTKDRECERGTLLTAICDYFGSDIEDKPETRRSWCQVLANPSRGTTFPRIFFAQTYLVKSEPVVILDNDEWLQREAVKKAFAQIVQLRAETDASWRKNLSPLSLAFAELHYAERLCWTALAGEHRLVCLVTNGLIVPNFEGKITPYTSGKKLIRSAECVFRPYDSFLERL